MPYLYRQHDQDVADDGDQTQGTCHDDDEHHLQGVVGTLREAGAGDTVAAHIGGEGLVGNLHPLCPRGGGGSFSR